MMGFSPEQLYHSMSSRRETILSAVQTALAGTSGVSSRIFRSRVEALAKSEHPAIVIDPVSDSAEREAIGRLNWELIFALTIVVRADTRDSAADSIVLSAHNKLMGNAALQSLLVDLLPLQTDWQFKEGDLPLAIVTMHFKAAYQTSETDLTTL